MTNTGHVAISRSGVITADILLSERCLKPCARVLHHHGKPFDAASIGSAAFILLPTLAIMGRPTRRHGRQGRRPATVQQGGLLTVLAGAVPGAGGDGGSGARQYLFQFCRAYAAEITGLQEL